MSSNFLLDVGFCCIIFKKVGLWELSGGTVVKTQPSHCGDPGQGTMILQAPGHDQKTKTKNKLDFFFFNNKLDVVPLFWQTVKLLADQFLSFVTADLK